MCSFQLLRESVHERMSAAAKDVLQQLEKREDAADLLAMRALITKRLIVTAEEIVSFLEKAVLEYQDRLQLSEQEIRRQKRLLQTLLKPKVNLQKAVCSVEIQTERSSDLNWEDLQGPEPLHIKEEQEEIWTGQDREQLQDLQDNGITKLTFSPVPVKSEDDEEKPQPSQLHYSHTTETRDSLGELEPIKTSDPPQSFLQPVSEDASFDSAETDESDCDWPQKNDFQSRVEDIQNSEVPESDPGSPVKEQPFPCSYCGKRFSLKGNLNRHIRDHTGERPFPCTDCNKSFKDSGSLTAHMRCHTGEQPYSCLFCGKNFSGRGNMTRHMRIHTGEKPFTCSVCNKSFHVKEHLNRHIKYHTGEKPFRCSVCGKGCAQKTDLKKHMRVHTGEKPFSCSFCGKCCAEKGDLTKHMRVHTGEKPFSCNICGKSCAQKGSLKIHMRVHTGEKPFSCSVCGKCFTVTGHLKRHMKLHLSESQLNEAADLHPTKDDNKVNSNEPGRAL